MKHFLPRFALIITLSIGALVSSAQPGSGWDWALTSGKATPSTGRQIRDIITDVSGNVYAVGDFEGSMTLGPNTLTTTGDGATNFNYDADAFVVKYNSAGTAQWAKQFGRAGTANNDRGEVINIDTDGNVYIGGNAGTAFLVKYDNNGNLLWNKSFTLFDLGGINFGADNNPIIMESNQSAKNIYKIDKATGNIMWTVSNSGVGSNSTSTFQDFVDQAGNIYYTAFGSGAVSVAGNNYNPSQTSTYIASLDNNGVTRWVNELPGVQVQLSYTIDKAGKSYVVIGGGSGTYQGIAIGGCAACGNHYLEFDAAGKLTYYTGISPFKALMRVTNNAIYSYGTNAGSSAASYTEIYGDNIIKSRPAAGQDVGLVVKYDVNTRQPLWAESYEVNGGNSLNTIEIAANGKAFVGGSYNTSIKFGTNTYTPTIVGQSAFNPLDFFIAEFNPANRLPSPTTTWTGNSNNGVWNDAGNWDQGFPNGNENSIIPSGVSNYPTNITTSNSTGKLTIGNGVSIGLPSEFAAPVGIVNNGIIEVKGTGSFSGFNTSHVSPLSGTGRLLFTANSPSIIFYDINNSLEINKPAGNIQSYGGTIAGSLFLTAGIFQASNPVALTDPNATITYSATSYVTGTLKRAINSSGTYIFPVGGATQFDGGPTMYAPVSISLTNVTGPQFLSVTFPGFRQTTGTTPNINLGGKTITSILSKNQWYITSDVALTGGSYSVSLQGGGYNNGVTDASRYVIIKRPDDNSPWGFYGTNGTSTQTGGTTSNGVVSNGTVNATVTGLTAFSTFSIGIASASVAAGTTVITSNWTGNAGTTWNDANNWDNGIPNGLINAKIPANKVNYPAIYTATDNARSVQNDATSSIKLPYNFLTNGEIINNGTIEVTGSAANTFSGFGTSTNGYAPLSGTGKLLFTTNSPGVFSGRFNNSIEINKLTSTLYAQSVYIGGSLNIISGNVLTSQNGNETFINMLSPGASVTATATYPVQGTLARNVSPSGTYNYPIGETSGRYAPVSIQTNNLAGTTTLSAQYYSTIYGGRKFVPIDNQPVSALNAGQWTITPGTAATGGTLNMTIEGRGYNNGVNDASRYVLLSGGTDASWAQVTGAVITENAGVVTATVSNLPALTAQTIFIFGIKGSTTQWTGAGNNLLWTTATNWSNGVPDNTTKAVFVAGSPNYPASISTSNTSAMLTIASGVTLRLPQTYYIPQGIINNGIIEVTGSSAFAGLGNGLTPLSGTGRLLFSSLSPSSISANTIINNGLELNRVGNFTVTTPTINGALILTSGLMVGNVTLTDPNGLLTYSPLSYIVGNLNRAVNTSGVYVFPIGTADRFVPATITLYNIVGPQSLLASFSTTINGATPNTTAQGVPVTQLLNTGIWTITPNNFLTGGNYSIKLEGRAYTNGVTDETRYVVLKRDASNYAWGFYGNNGPATQIAGVVTASGGKITSLSDFGIGIANSTVGATLPLNLVSFTAAKKDANILLQWSTANEVNIDRIIVQHSNDAINWKEAGSMPALNKPTNSYSFSHVALFGKTNYYRLQLKSNDGSLFYSDIRRVTMESKALVQAYPNPVNADGFTLDLGRPVSDKIEYRVLDLTGKIIKVGAIQNQQQYIPMNGLAAGVYLLKLADGTIIQLQKR